MVDIFARLEKNAGGPIGQYMRIAHGYFAFPKLEGELGPHMRFRGKMMLNWSLNNYLGLANHPEVRLIRGNLAEHMDELKQYRGVDLVFGGPPCQGFSVAGKWSRMTPAVS